MNAPTFQQRLRNAMEEKGVSARELGRRLRPDAAENGRRMVQKYLAAGSPQVPRRARRRELAIALGLKPDTFDDDLVEQLMARLAPVLEALAAEIAGGRRKDVA